MHEMSLGQVPQLWRCNWGQVHAGRSRHCLREWWSLLLIPYDADLYLDGAYQRLEPSGLLLVPPGVEKIYEHPVDARHQFVHFRVRKTQQRCAQMPQWVPLTAAEIWQHAFQELIDLWQGGDVLAAEVSLWKLLLEIQRQFGSESGRAFIHPAARAALQILHQDLVAPPSLAQLAAQVGLSKNHLNTLFKRCYNETVHAALTRLRMERAHDLLSHSDVAIAQVAKTVGIHDPQAFNKIIHKHFAKSPSALRRSYFKN